MPKIREICEIINNSLKAGQFKSRKFQKGNWQKLAYLVSREEKSGEDFISTNQPAIIDNDGEGIPVGYDDTYPIQFYHRIIAPLQYPDLSININEGFGNPATDNKEIAEMVLICMGDRARLGVFTEDICAAICVDIPRELTPTQLSTLGLEEVEIELVDVNTDPETVFAQEYKGIEFALAPENFMVAVKYRITSLYNSECFSLC